MDVAYWSNIHFTHTYLIQKCAFRVTVIILGNGVGDLDTKILDGAVSLRVNLHWKVINPFVLISIVNWYIIEQIGLFSVNLHWKVINPFVLISIVNWYIIEQVGLFSLDMATNLGERKLEFNSVVSALKIDRMTQYWLIWGLLG